MAPPKFKRLVRFRSTAGDVCYGEVSQVAPDRQSLVGSKVPLYKGAHPWDDGFEPSGLEGGTIAEVLCPLAAIPIGYGIGVNYKAHAAEAKLPPIEYPLAFTKTPGTLAGPYQDVPFSVELKDLDYEGELTVVIGKACKNLGENEDPTPYILGYTVGNDVSSRYWQAPARCGSQHGYAKSFDKFGPIGPVIVSTAAIPDPGALLLTTKVNGELRQSTRTDDLIYDIPAILRHLSRGTTLQPGTVIMTGTPGGVAAFMSPPAWLKHGDVVDVEISQIGKISNRMVLE